MKPNALGLSALLTLNACNPSGELIEQCKDQAEGQLEQFHDPILSGGKLSTHDQTSLLQIRDTTKDALTQVCLNAAETKRVGKPMFCYLQGWSVSMQNGETWECGKEERPIGDVYVAAGTREEMKRWRVDDVRSEISRRNEVQYSRGDPSFPTSDDINKERENYIRNKQGLDNNHPITGPICDTSASTPEDANCAWFYPEDYSKSPFARTE